MDIFWFGLIVINDWFLLFVGILISLYYYFTWNFGWWESQGVPGPKPYPILGTMLPFIKKGVWMDLDNFKKYGSVVGTMEGRTPALLVSDPEFIKHVLIKEFHATGSRREAENGSFMDLNLFNANGDHWKLLRHTMSPTFSTGKIKQMMKQLTECSKLLTENLAEDVKAGNDFDIRSYTGSYTMDAIARVAFGLSIDSQKEKNNEFVTKTNQLFDNVGDAGPAILVFFLFPQLTKYLAKLGVNFIPKDFLSFFSNVVTQALELRDQDKTERKDFLNILKTANQNVKNSPSDKFEDGVPTNYEKRPLTMDEIKAQAILFFIAGYDTTANALCWLIYSLACNPEIQEKVYEEIQEVIGDNENPTYEKLNELPYLDLCIHETLRLYPSATRLDRMVTQDVTIKGIKLKKGNTVILSPFTMHRLPEYFPEPEKFKPERFSEKHIGYLDSYYYLPFGGGPRACIGMRLALIELKLATVHLLQNYKFKTTSRTVIPPSFGSGLNLREKNGTWLKAELRSN